MTVPARRWRQLTVWLHVLTSVGWMTMALVLFALLLRAATAGPADATAAVSTAHYLDTVLLAPITNASAATGIMLALGTSWGLFVHRWVLAKFAITLVQLYAGIFLLSGALQDAAAAGSGIGVTPALVAGTAAMASAIAFQAWLSIAKPGRRTRWGRDPRTDRAVQPTPAPAWTLIAAFVAPLCDIAVGTALGYPAPVLSVLTLVTTIAVRQRRRSPRTPVALP